MEHTEVANSITESAQADPQPKLDSKKPAVFTLTPGELILLVEHWTMRLIRDELFPITYFEFSYGGYGRLFRTDPITGVDLPAIVDKHNQYPTVPGNRIKNWDRINEIAQVLGDELTDKTIVETYQEESQEYPRNPWIIIRYGNSDEKFEYEKVRRACGDPARLAVFAGALGGVRRGGAAGRRLHLSPLRTSI